jgi:hypothetical protein
VRPDRPLGQGWIDSTTHDVHEMDVKADEDVRRVVVERGGELYVWLTHHGWAMCGVTILEAETQHPGLDRHGHDRQFRRIRSHRLGFDLYVETGERVWPRTLELALDHRGRKVRAYWNGLALVA